MVRIAACPVITDDPTKRLLLRPHGAHQICVRRREAYDVTVTHSRLDQRSNARVLDVVTLPNACSDSDRHRWIAVINDTIRDEAAPVHAVQLVRGKFLFSLAAR